MFVPSTGIRKCSIGRSKNLECHLKTQNPDAREVLFACDELSTHDREYISMTSEVNLNSPNATLCEHHRWMFYDKYHLRWKNCCAPFHPHKPAAHGRYEISLDLAKCMRRSPDIKKTIIPGQKLCKGCSTRVNKLPGAPLPDAAPLPHAALASGSSGGPSSSTAAAAAAPSAGAAHASKPSCEGKLMYLSNVIECA